ncbi:MAG: hypothetical protein ACMUIM_06585 [bacterium]
MHSDNFKWLFSLKESILGFLSNLKSVKHQGYYKYSLNGDLYDEQYGWGLGNSVFAAKIYYMLNEIEEYEREFLINFIKSFQDNHGYIYDRKIERLSRLNRIVAAIQQRDFNNFFNEQTKRAETRQSFCALNCLGSKPNTSYLHIPYTKERIAKYIHKLNWKKPWGAASHVSHIVFFLYYNSVFFNICLDKVNDLIDYALEVSDDYRQEDGSWYAPGSHIQTHQKVNSAMKMITAFDACGRSKLDNSEGLIDLCLATINEGDACNNFNIVYVLYHCCKKTDYRSPEIKKYFLERLDLYKRHYWPQYGGFSFFEGKANSTYYWARISKGLPEPDIHGTMLFLSGIVFISEVLGIRNELGIRVPFI